MAHILMAYGNIYNITPSNHYILSYEIIGDLYISLLSLHGTVVIFMEMLNKQIFKTLYYDFETDFSHMVSMFEN